MKKLLLILVLVGLIGCGIVSANDENEIDFYMLSIVDFWAHDEIKISTLLSAIDIWSISSTKFEVLRYDENRTLQSTGKIKGFDILFKRMFWTINEYVNEEDVSDFQAWQNSVVEFGYVYQMEIAELNLTNRTNSAIWEIQKLDLSEEE